MKSCPCRYCEERTMFCHSSCVDYVDWKKDYEKAKADYVNERKQIQVAFQEELQKMFDPMARRAQKQEAQEDKKEDKKVEQSKPKKSPYTDFGLGPAEVYKPSFLKDGIIFW